MREVALGHNRGLQSDSGSGKVDRKQAEKAKQQTEAAKAGELVVCLFLGALCSV